MRRRRCHVGRGGRSVAGRMGKAGSAGGRREAGRGGRWAAPRPPAPARSPRPRCAPSPGPQPGPRAPASRPPHRPQGAPPQRRGLVFILGVSWSQGTLPGLGEGCAPRGGGRGVLGNVGSLGPAQPRGSTGPGEVTSPTPFPPWGRGLNLANPQVPWQEPVGKHVVHSFIRQPSLSTYPVPGVLGAPSWTSSGWGGDEEDLKS